MTTSNSVNKTALYVDTIVEWLDRRKAMYPKAKSVTRKEINAILSYEYNVRVTTKVMNLTALAINGVIRGKHDRRRIVFN